MKKHELLERTDWVVGQMRTALQTIYDSLNQGQKIQLLKHEEIKTMFDRYSVKY